jgi:tetratricopeptide (TPR) repeat protein
VSGAATAAKQDDSKLAKALGVTILIKGTLQASADRIAITMRAEDIGKQRTLLTKEFRGVRQDLLTLEDEIFDALAGALAIQQSVEERARSTARPTQDLGAYELYLKGVSVLRGKRDAATAQEALALFESATKADPAFALAYTGIADACMRVFLATKDREWTQRALGAAQQAEQLKRDLPEAHYSLGVVYSTMGRTAEAIGELQLALKLAPNSDEGLRRLGLAYKNAGRLDEAAAAYGQAVRVNPYYWRNYDLLGGAYFRLGDNAKALAAYTEEAKLEPGNSRGWSGKGAANYRLGDWNAAIAAFQKAIELDPQPLYYSQLGTAYFFLGRYADAAKTFETGLEKAPDDPVLNQYLADAYKWSGQPDKAAAGYTKSIELAFRDLKASPKSKELLALLGVSFAKKGDAAQALEFIRQARQIDREDNDLMYKEATVHTLAGRLPEAFASLKEALRRGYSAHEADADPELKPLRDRKAEFDAAR